MRSICPFDLTGALFKGKVILQPMRAEPSMVLLQRLHLNRPMTAGFAGNSLTHCNLLKSH
jgi:hypothetical protein